MLEIIISVALYVGALVLLVKGAFAFCNNSHENVCALPPKTEHLIAIEN